MKKRVKLTIALACLALPLAAEVSVGGNFGYAYTVDNLARLKNQGYSVTQTEFPFSAEAGWKFSFDADSRIFADPGIVVGVRIGRSDIMETTPPEGLKNFVNVKLATVPLLAFVRAEAGYAYLDAACGAHFWDIDYRTEVSNLGNAGQDLAASFSLGGRVSPFDRLILRAGPIVSYYAIPSFAANLSANSLTVGASVGASFEF